MANLAKIQSIAQGQFFVKDSLGNLTELKVGDTVSLNDTIVAANSNTDLSKIEILFDTNELITLSQGEQLLDATLLASTFGNEELAFDKQEVDETLNAWNNTEAGDATDMETAAGDVTEQATNAGDERAADGGALRSRFNSRTGDSTDVRSDLRDGDFDGGNPENPQEQIPTELLNPVGATTPTTPTIPVDTRVPASVINLEDITVKEGEGITITATVTNPPQTDLIITLSNGKTTQTITIPAGQTTGSVKFDNPNGEDVYKDGETLNYTITGTTGGNYVSLDTSDSSVVTIEDTEDTTTVTVTTANVTENDPSVTFNFQLSNVPDTDANGVMVPTTLTVNIGGTVYTLDVDADGKASKIITTEDRDVYTDPSSLTATVTAINGGNFEATSVATATATATAQIADANVNGEDTTTVTVTTANVTENDPSVTFNFQLSNVPDTDANGVMVPTTLTVNIGGTVYTLDVDADGKASKIITTEDRDVYTDPSSLTATVTAINGGNFEATSVATATATATAQIADANVNGEDTTTVTIEPIVTSSNTIDISNINDKASGYEVKAYSSYTDYANKTKGDISTVGNATAFGNAVRGFGVKGDDASNGDERELGKGEAIVIDFKAKDILSVDVSLAWRNQAEKADITFLDKNGNKVGSASLTGGKNGNLEATSTITYKDASGHQIGNPITIQGGSDGIDKPFELKLPNGQLFNKVVFTAPGTNDDYLINSIQYKEVVVDNSSSVITGNGEVVFKIETSNIPDPSEYNDANPPKAKVEIQISGSSEIITKEVTLDREGKGTVLVQADGTKTITAKVTEIIGGNFEAVDYSSAKSTITVGTTNPTAGNDKIDVVEDTAYTLQISDFGNTQTDVAKIQFKDLPSIDSGKLYILNSLVTSSTNERADYTQTDSGKVFVSVNVGDIVDITQIQQGNVIFVPKENSDVDGRFTFQVGDGNGKWSDDSTPYKTEIIVKAVADAPTVSIDVTKENHIDALAFNGNNFITGNLKNEEAKLKLHSPNQKTTIQDKGFGVFGNMNNGNSGKSDSQGIDRNETLVLNLKKEVSTATFKLSIDTNSNISGAWTAFDKAGNQVSKNIDFSINSNGDIIVTAKDNVKFQYVSFEGKTSGQSASDAGYFVKPISLDGKSIEMNEYKLDISASLTDTDESEELSNVTIKNIPNGSVLSGENITDNKDGSYTVKVDVNGDAKITLTNSKELSDADLDGIQANAISTDTPTDSSEAVSNAISFAGGGDIDLSNLKNIVNLKEINLDNGKENKLSLTLDDVLKLSGDDGKIKITGDEFDSVSFKDTKDSNGISQSWSKTAGEGVDKGFDIYVNSGDPTLQVKVEQPISDGITN